ncbi:hypothetical protein CORC01_04611 [Colletotrichum orchidophilum]|uniref:Uncharacterized protein n=1 Tax=Colletotrichum orchidophilum TaxID=1209926 RepID=A0A1G4BEU4_9PEZI|nr:uncharacterized protein CORC01_04611 [Colletotrichum orchidophilum]OHE99964.1 hypothetical protein CORC01_04611 [Colletotrichum orchidophilum]
MTVRTVTGAKRCFGASARRRNTRTRNDSLPCLCHQFVPRLPLETDLGQCPSKQAPQSVLAGSSSDAASDNIQGHIEPPASIPLTGWSRRNTRPLVRQRAGGLPSANEPRGNRTCMRRCNLTRHTVFRYLFTSSNVCRQLTVARSYGTCVDKPHRALGFEIHWYSDCYNPWAEKWRAVRPVPPPPFTTLAGWP